MCHIYNYLTSALVTVTMPAHSPPLPMSVSFPWFPSVLLLLSDGYILRERNVFVRNTRAAGGTYGPTAIVCIRDFNLILHILLSLFNA